MKLKAFIMALLFCFTCAFVANASELPVFEVTNGISINPVEDAPEPYMTVDLNGEPTEFEFVEAAIDDTYYAAFAKYSSSGERVGWFVIRIPTYSTDGAVYSLETCADKALSYSRPSLMFFLGTSVDAYMATYNFYKQADAYPYNSAFYIIIDKVSNEGHTFEGRFSGRLVQSLNTDSSVVVNNGKFRFTINTSAKDTPEEVTPSSSNDTIQMPGDNGDHSGSTICIACAGSGRCNVCKGTGIYSNYGISDTCSACSGTGVCQICGGKGTY